MAFSPYSALLLRGNHSSTVDFGKLASHKRSGHVIPLRKTIRYKDERCIGAPARRGLGCIAKATYPRPERCCAPKQPCPEGGVLLTLNGVKQLGTELRLWTQAVRLVQISK